MVLELFFNSGLGGGWAVGGIQMRCVSDRGGVSGRVGYDIDILGVCDGSDDGGLVYFLFLFLLFIC